MLFYPPKKSRQNIVLNLDKTIEIQLNDEIIKKYTLINKHTHTHRQQGHRVEAFIGKITLKAIFKLIVIKINVGGHESNAFNGTEDEKVENAIDIKRQL